MSGARILLYTLGFPGQVDALAAFGRSFAYKWPTADAPFVLDQLRPRFQQNGLKIGDTDSADEIMIRSLRLTQSYRFVIGQFVILCLLVSRIIHVQRGGLTNPVSTVGASCRQFYADGHVK